MMAGRELYEAVERLYREAEEAASLGGVRLGAVSRAYPVELREGRRALAIEIPFRDYHEFASGGGRLSMGDFVCVASPLTRTLLLGRVVGFRREDVMSMAGVPAPPAAGDYSTVMTPLVLYVELVSERPFAVAGGALVLGGETSPPASPVEPMSPVFLPNARVLREMLGLPRGGALLGVLRQGSRERWDVGVSLDFSALYHHALVVGTTGSGKTVLLKNLVLALASAESPEPPLVVALDVQGDYLHVVLPNEELSESERRLRPLDSLAVICPVTSAHLSALCSKVAGVARAVGDPKVAINLLGAEMAEEYVASAFSGLLELVDCEVLSSGQARASRLREVRAVCLSLIHI